MAQLLDWYGARVRSTRDLTRDIRLFEIDPGDRFVAPTPGSHINVTVQIGERPDVRSYSIVGPCTDGIYRIAVKLLADSRGGSTYMWSLQPGARLTISGPGNHFELTRGGLDYLLLAGGIGITPIYSMALALAATDACVRVLYACRTREDLALAEELRNDLGDRLETFVDADRERVDLSAEIARLHPDGELYVCGPIGLLEAAKAAWQKAGRPVDRLRFETFGNSGRFASEEFLVSIPRLGRSITVPRNQSLLDALEAAGVDMIYDCRRGECGLCKLDIIEVNGTVDHRDVFFSDDEKAASKALCTCVSRVIGAVTLDTGDRAS